MIATQLYYGPREREAFGTDDVDAAIANARSIAGIDALVIWPSENLTETARFARTCRMNGIEPWLWFPVLADSPGTVPAAEDLVTASDGTRGNGRIGAWPGLAGGDETFLFSCPNNDRYVERVFGVFSSLIDRLDIAGAMLDRIRYPSPANGFEMLLSCFCDSCGRRFRLETGEPLSALARRAEAFRGRMRRLTAASFSAEWTDSDTLWSAAGLAELARFRERSVLALAERFAYHARSKGRKIGMDLFSPSLAGIVAQHYPSLAALCDWIKPMIYCHAQGPAGLPLEARCLTEALAILSPGLSLEEARAATARALRMDVPASASFPLETISHELDVLEGMKLPPAVQVLAGIEAVRLPRFGVDVTEALLDEALCRIEGCVQGLVASWNLLHIPVANLRRIGEFARRS